MFYCLRVADWMWLWLALWSGRHQFGQLKIPFVMYVSVWLPVHQRPPMIIYEQGQPIWPRCQWAHKHIYVIICNCLFCISTRVSCFCFSTSFNSRSVCFNVVCVFVLWDSESLKRLFGHVLVMSIAWTVISTVTIEFMNIKFEWYQTYLLATADSIFDFKELQPLRGDLFPINVSFVRPEQVAITTKHTLIVCTQNLTTASRLAVCALRVVLIRSKGNCIQKEIPRSGAVPVRPPHRKMPFKSPHQFANIENLFWKALKTTAIDSLFQISIKRRGLKRNGHFALSTPATDCLVDDIDAVCMCCMALTVACGTAPTSTLERTGEERCFCSVLVNLFYK